MGKTISLPTNKLINQHLYILHLVSDPVIYTADSRYLDLAYLE